MMINTFNKLVDFLSNGNHTTAEKCLKYCLDRCYFRLFLFIICWQIT